MARFFDITAVTTSIELDADRTGQAAFTVTNATSASIRGDAVAVPQPGAETAKYDIDEPSRHFGPGATEQLTVKVTAPAEMAPGTYGFRLRMLLGGGVPEEQFDDGPTVKYAVAKIEEPPPPPPPPPKKPFPWWIVAVIVAVIAIIVIGAIVWFVFLRTPPLTGDSVRITAAQPTANTTIPGGGQTTTFQFTIQYSMESQTQAYLVVYMADFPGATSCAGIGTQSTLGYVVVDSGTGQVAIPVTWAPSAAQGRVAPQVTYWQMDGFTKFADFGPDPAYCYRYGP